MIVIYHVNDYNRIMKLKRDIQAVVLLSAALIGQMSIGMLTLGLVFFMRDTFQLGPQAIGLFASSATLTYFLGCVFLKKAVSRLKPRHAVEIASSGMMITSILILFAPQPWVAFLSYMAYGLFMSLYWPPIMGWLTRGMEGGELSRRISWFNLSWSLGIGFAPYLAGVLTEYHAALAVLVSGALMGVIFLGIVIATAAVPEIKAIVSSQTHTKTHGLQDSSTNLRYITWLGLFSAYVIFGVTMNVFPLYARAELLLRESTIGMLLLIRGLVTAGFFVLMGRSSLWQYNRKLMLFTQIFLAGACLAGLFSITFITLSLFFMLFGVAFAALYTNSIFHGAAGSVDRESRMAIHEAVLTAGVILGSSLGGSIYQYGSFAAVMGVSIAVSLLILFLQLLFLRYNRLSTRANRM
jgi:MFS family permease